MVQEEVEIQPSETEGAEVQVTAELAAKRKPKPRTIVTLLHCDVIEDKFWTARPYLLA